METSLEEFQANIERLGGEQSAEAGRLSARNVGQISRDARNALLAQGVDPNEIEQRLAGGFEGSARSLRDLQNQIGLQTQQALVGAEQFGISGQLTAEGLAQSQRGLSQGQLQFNQSLAESVRQFGSSQAQNQQQFEAGLGFKRQTLAQDARQFEADQRAQSARGFGKFFGTALGAGAGFFLAGPAGAVAGAQIGSSAF